MPNTVSRADFCRLSLSGFIGAAACSRSQAPHPDQAVPASPVPAPAVASSPAPQAAGVPKRTLGSTGEQVSMLGLGGAHIGNKDKLNDEQAIRLMRDAIE